MSNDFNASEIVMVILGFVGLVAVAVIGAFLVSASWHMGSTVFDSLKATPESEARFVQEQKQWETSPNNPVYACTSKGGIPILSAWDGRLKRCEGLK